MKKLFKLVFIILICFISFTACNTIPLHKIIYVEYYGLVRYNEEFNQLLIYIPNIGDVEIPEYEKIYGLNDKYEDNDNSYQLKNGDFIVIQFKHKNNWYENNVKIMESYPAKFDQKAYYIDVLKENISYNKNNNEYQLSFPLEKDLEININDKIAFLDYEGENGRVKVTKIAEGIVLNINENIITVSLNLLISEKEFFENFPNSDIDLIFDY